MIHQKESVLFNFLHWLKYLLPYHTTFYYPSNPNSIENKHSVAPEKFLPHILTETWLFVIELFHLWLLLVLSHLKHFKFRDENLYSCHYHTPKKQTLVFDTLRLCLLPLLSPIPFITLIFINIRHSSVGTMFYCFSPEMSPGTESYWFSLPCLLSSAFKFDVLVDTSAFARLLFLHD